MLLPGIAIGQSTLTAAEYFFDTDPGVGNATGVPAFAASGNIDITFSAASSSLSAGMHILGVRVKDIADTWSIPSYMAVYVFPNDLLATETITGGEYFFDSDPGIGNGTTITGITAGGVVDVTYLANSAALTTGMHILGVRTVNNLGLWSAPSFISFYVDVDRSIDKLEYYVDTDPGAGSATQILISPPISNIDMDVVIPTASLPNGTYTLGVRAGRIDDNWSATATAAFTICSYATASFSANIACAGAATTFTDNSTNTLPGDVYNWDFDNDGTIDDTTVGNTSFTYTAAGTYTATLEIDRSGCTDVFSTIFTVEPAPTPDAGIDQNICSNDAALSANAPGTGETGLWNVISGNATITDPADPLSTITGITSYSTVLEWTISNTVGACAVSDQVTILSNQPISAALVSVSASLGEMLNADVQSSAVINPGDVLTTTIITAPAKGIASVAADGTINYTPDPGTVGSDVVAFQLCNQCGKCASADLEINIINNAPVITPAPVSAGNVQNVRIDLSAMISDPNNNLDPSSLSVTQQPASGATATIEPPFTLRVDYTGIFFSGTDQLTIQVCDLAGVCSSNIIAIEVDITDPPVLQDPPITVYNAISPNGDGRHDFLEIENITAYPENLVYVFNRWGNRVFEATGYDNSQIRFAGTGNAGGAGDLPGGTYFYSIDLGNASPRITGFLILKR